MSFLQGNFPKYPILVLLAGLAFGLFCFMAFYPFPIAGHDSFTHLEWFEQFSTLHDQGIWYPRWLPLSMGGFGSIAFYFYPPLSFIFGGFLHSIWPAATPSILFHSVHFLAGIATIFIFSSYLWLNGVRRKYAILCGVFVAIAPYRFYDIFQRAALGESISFCWIALFLLAIEHSRQTESLHRWKGCLYSAIATCGLVMSNVPLTVIAVMLLPIYTVTRVGWRNVTRLWPMAVGSILGALCAAIYLLPVIGMLHLVPTGHLSDVFDHDHRWGFLLRELFLKDVQKDASSFLVPFTLALVIIAVALGRREFKTSRFFRAIAIVGLVAVFLQLPFVSLPVWDAIPLFGLIQFTIRFNVITTLAAAGMLAYLLEHKPRSIGPPVVIGMSFLFLVLVFSRFIHIVFTEHLPPYLGPERKNTAEQVPIFASAEGLGSYYYARLHMFDKPIEPTTSRLRNRLARQDSSFAELPKGDTLYESSHTAKERVFHAMLSRPTRVRIHQYYWPYWVLHRDTSTLLQSDDEHGLIIAELPAGNYDMNLTLEKSLGEKSGAAVSMIAGFLVLIVIGRVILLAVRRKPTGEEDQQLEG